MWFLSEIRPRWVRVSPFLISIDWKRFLISVPMKSWSNGSIFARRRCADTQSIALQTTRHADGTRRALDWFSNARLWSPRCSVVLSKLTTGWSGVSIRGRDRNRWRWLFNVSRSCWLYGVTRRENKKIRSQFGKTMNRMGTWFKAFTGRENAVRLSILIGAT